MKKSLALGLISCVPLFGLSQQFTGYSYDNYSGVQGMLQNPASVAGSKYKVNINFFSISTLAGNNAYELKNAKFKNFDFTDLKENQDYFKSSNTDNKNLWFNTDILGPSVMFTASKKSGIGLYTRARTLINEFNLSDKTFRYFGSGTSDGIYDIPIHESMLQLKAHAFAEAGLTYGRIIWSAPHHLLKMGITGKYIVGLAAASVYSNKLALNIAKSNFINELNGDANVRYSSNLDAVDNNFGDAFKHAGSNHGLGLDVGFTYEWRPESSGWLTTDQTPYKVRLSGSLNDLGSVSYDNSKHGNSYSVNATGRTTDDLNKQDGENFDQYFTRLQNMGIITTQAHADKMKVKLPTTFRFDADYHIYRRLFINAGTIVNLINRDQNQTTAQYATTFTVTPRLEKKWFSLYTPFYYNAISKKSAIGAGMRLGPLFLGSGSILSNMFSNKNVSTADFHMGFTLPIYQRVKIYRHRSHPKEEVKAEAPKPQPVVEQKIVETKVVETKVDTVVRKVEVIKEVTHDRDNDGIVDEKDECPDVAGEVALAGCPDRDKDGIADKNDKCPDVAGTAKYNGCPIPDTDGDGINDEEDKCPAVAGTAKYNGCPIPDTDGDGVNDEEDKCPNTPGKPANNGCPEIKQEVAKKVAIAAKAIYYMSGKDVIQKVSYPKLDIVVKVLKADPALQISIEGHTDNKGKPETNLKLSAKRAQAVKNYLIKKGIAESRITAQGFGDSKPITTNATPQGRAKNRRVELHLNYQ
jgi:outer membrane protein OmpA-like peptidoglycan-associated protein